MDRFWVGLGSTWRGPKCLAHRQGRVAEHFRRNLLFWLRERLGLDFAPPRPAFGASLNPLGRSLGAPGRSISVPVEPEGAFWSSSGAVLGASWSTLRCSGAPLGLPKAPWTLWGPFWDRFRTDVWLISEQVYALTFLSIVSLAMVALDHLTCARQPSLGASRLLAITLHDVLHQCNSCALRHSSKCSLARPGCSSYGPSHMCAE